MNDYGHNIVILDGGYSSYDYEKSLLEMHGYHLKFYTGDPRDLLAKIEFVGNAEGMFVRGTSITREFLSTLYNMRVIVRYGVGYDNIDLAAASARGIRVANVQGYASHSVSDHAIALLYACIRGLPAGQSGIISSFGKPPDENIFELYSKTIGIVGLGRIGGTFCKKVKGLCSRIIAFDPFIPGERFLQMGAEPVDLETLMQESDIISIHCSLNETSNKLFDDNAFSKMKKRPVIINTARGEVVDESALLNALQNNNIYGVGLDVFYQEPIAANNKLLTHPHVIATGHYAWYSDTAAKELQKRAAHNMLGLLNGEKMEDWLNP